MQLQQKTVLAFSCSKNENFYLKCMIHSQEDLRKLLDYKENKERKIPLYLFKKIFSFKEYDAKNIKNIFFDDRYKNQKTFKKIVEELIAENFKLCKEGELLPFDLKGTGLLIPNERNLEEEKQLKLIVYKKSTGKTLRDYMRKKIAKKEKVDRPSTRVRLSNNKENERMTFIYIDNMRRSPFFKRAIKTDKIYSYEKIDLVPDYDFCSSEIDEFISGDDLNSSTETTHFESEFSDILEEKYKKIKQQAVRSPFLNVFNLKLQVYKEENIEEWKKLPLIKSRKITEEIIDEIKKQLPAPSKKIAEELSIKYNLHEEPLLRKIRELKNK